MSGEKCAKTRMTDSSILASGAVFKWPPTLCLRQPNLQLLVPRYHSGDIPYVPEAFQMHNPTVCHSTRRVSGFEDLEVIASQIETSLIMGRTPGMYRAT